jgi:hypothetical protein
MSAHDDAATAERLPVLQRRSTFRARAEDLDLCLRLARAACAEASLPIPPRPLMLEDALLTDGFAALLERAIEEVRALHQTTLARDTERPCARDFRARALRATLRALNLAQRAASAYRDALRSQLSITEVGERRPALTVITGLATTSKIHGPGARRVLAPTARGPHRKAR